MKLTTARLIAGQIKNKEQAEPLSKEGSWHLWYKKSLAAAMPLALYCQLGIIGYIKGRCWAGNTLFLVQPMQPSILPVIHICGGQEKHDGLVSRPFSIPFQCAKMEGGGLKNLVTYGDIGQHQLDTRQTYGGDVPQKISTPFLVCWSKSRRPEHSYNINRVWYTGHRSI